MTTFVIRHSCGLVVAQSYEDGAIRLRSPSHALICLQCSKANTTNYAHGFTLTVRVDGQAFDAALGP